jgi:hypothetical protein
MPEENFVPCITVLPELRINRSHELLFPVAPPIKWCKRGRGKKW